jgi:seryl-tRNA synthetase
MEDLKNVLSNRLNAIVILVIVIFSFQIFNLVSNGNEVQKVNYIKKEIQSIKDEVKDIYKSEEAMGHKIDTFNLRIKGIDEEVEINNTKIDNLKKNEKIQIDNFKSYDASMWEQYFTDRYTKNNLLKAETGK